MKNIDGDLAIQFGGVCKVNFTHASLTERLDDLIVGYLCTRLHKCLSLSLGYRLSRTTSRNAMEHTLGTDILVNIRPVDTMSIADNFEI